MRSRSLVAGFAGVGTLCLVAIGTSSAQNAQTQETITAEQAIECIRTATGAMPRKVEGLDVELERGQLVCEVEIVAETGAKSEIHIDVATNKILRGAR